MKQDTHHIIWIFIPYGAYTKNAQALLQHAGSFAVVEDMNEEQLRCASLLQVANVQGAFLRWEEREEEWFFLAAKLLAMVFFVDLVSERIA